MVCGIKHIILLSFLGISSVVSAKTFYVSPVGSNSNPGTISQPWLTFQYSESKVSAGDTVYFRGGIYPVTSVIEINVSGTHDEPICFFNYHGEKPIFDGEGGLTNDAAFFINKASYLEFNGLTVENIDQVGSSRYAAGFMPYLSDNIIFTNCVAHDIGVRAFHIMSCDSIYIINCDAYNVPDTGEGGEHGDGFLVNGYGYEEEKKYCTYFSGCRAWNCADDGWDAVRADGLIIYDSCWSFLNGHNGFKFGLNYFYEDQLGRIFRNCVAAYNVSNGFNTNDANGPTREMYLYNNTSYKNGQYGFLIYNSGDPEGIDLKRTFKNNISYDNVIGAVGYSGVPYTHDHNSWDISGLTVTDADFISIDSTGIMGTRGTGGSLPKVNFLKLASTSDLIDAGTDVDLPYYANAPDLGYSEYLTGSVSVVSPIFQKSVIENATPSRLEMTYNLTLANIVPAASAFSVYVNSVARSVSSVAVSGTKVLLTLTSPVVYGDVVTVAYTKPTTNPLQTASGGQAASLTPQNVTNNVVAASPVYLSSIIENATASRLEMTYNLTLANIVPATSAFSVYVNSVARSVSSVAVSGTKVLLTLTSPVGYGEVVTVAYTKPATNPLQIASGGQAVSLTAQPVINNCSLTANQPPVITIISPTKSLVFVAPATITIEATASDPDGSISKVEFYNGNKKLGEISMAPFSFAWKEVPEGTYTLTTVATDNFNAISVSDVVDAVVEKSAYAVNLVPIVNLTLLGNSKKPKKHDNIVLIAEAYDSDGAISKVEFKSGSTTLAEITSAPYEYIWEDIDTGTYTITAIATDNLGATAASSALELVVAEFYDVNSEIINLYPNPNDGHFAIDIYSGLPDQNNRITVMSLSGTTVYYDRIKDQESYKEFDLSDTSAGTYVLMVVSGNKIITAEKFIKR